MAETIEVGGVMVDVTRKDVKHVHLSVHPPHGRVTLVAPLTTRLDVARAYAVTKMGWIRDQQERLQSQARESPRRFIGRESHFLWGRRYLMTVIEKDEKPSVRLDHRTIHLTVRPGSTTEKKSKVIHDWHKSLLHRAVPAMIRKWEKKLGVETSRYFLQRMKTKWGGCSPATGTIRLNTELAKKPKDLLEYVIVHELMHLLEPRHSERFFELMHLHYPAWPEARKELNALPLGAEHWVNMHTA